MSSAESPPVRRLWRAVLCGYLALGASLQELPGYLVARFGAGTTVVGLVVGAAFAATAVTRPFAGRAGDTGHARPVVITGGGLTALAAVGHLLAPNVGALLVFRLLMGAGEAALFSAALPWALARAAADRRGRVTGWFGLSMWGGLSVGPLLATAVHGFGGSSGVWYTVIALGSLSAALAVSAGRQMPSSGGCRSGPPRGSLRAGLLTGIGLPGLCLGLAAYGYGSLTALLVLYLTGTHYDEARGIGLTVFAGAFLVTRGVGSPVVDRLGGAVVGRFFLAIEAAGLALLATVRPAALVATAVTGIGVALVYPATVAVTVDHTGGHHTGTTVGAMTSCWDLGILVAGPVSGAVAAGFGYGTAFALAAGLAAAASVLMLGAGSRRQVASVSAEPSRRLS